MSATSHASFLLCCSYCHVLPCRSWAATPSLLAARHLHHRLLPGQRCTATLTTNFANSGLTTDLTLLGGVYCFIVLFILFPNVLHIPHSIETLTYACTHTLVLRVLALYSASKPTTQKTPHTCLYQPHDGYHLWAKGQAAALRLGFNSPRVTAPENNQRRHGQHDRPHARSSPDETPTRQPQESRKEHGRPRSPVREAGGPSATDEGGSQGKTPGPSRLKPPKMGQR
jgi:hypothetical protein